MFVDVTLSPTLSSSILTGPLGVLTSVPGMKQSPQGPSALFTDFAALVTSLSLSTIFAPSAILSIAFATPLISFSPGIAPAAAMSAPL
jgi:hypothetical protein